MLRPHPVRRHAATVVVGQSASASSEYPGVGRTDSRCWYRAAADVVDQYPQAERSGHDHHFDHSLSGRSRRDVWRDRNHQRGRSGGARQTFQFVNSHVLFFIFFLWFCFMDLMFFEFLMLFQFPICIFQFFFLPFIVLLALFCSCTFTLFISSK